MHRGLAHLQAAEFLYETSLFPELAYTFKHALTHEVAYGGLLQERRRGLHARIVEALEALYARPAGRAGRTAGAPCLPGRGVGQGRDLLPAGRRQGLRPRRVPRGGGLPSSRPSRPSRTCLRDGDTRVLAIELRLALEGRAARTGRAWAEPCPAWARPRPWPGRSTIGPGWDGCWPGWPVCSGRRETTTAPWRRASKPSSSRLRSAIAPCRCKRPIAWGRPTMPSATSAGRPSC